MKHDYEIQDHGVFHDQYFQGAGVSFTRFDNITTGIGNSPYEALNDALDHMAWSGAFAELIEHIEATDLPNASETVDAHGDGYWHYVSIRWVEQPAAAPAPKQKSKPATVSDRDPGEEA